MAKTEVILTSNIVGLGAESDQVKVAAGYARNYLLPQRLAIPLTRTNKRQLEVLKQRRAEREAHEFNTMSELSKSLSKLVCLVRVKTGEDGKMFGAVTPGMIADELKHQFDVSLDRKKIHLDQPIRALGDHEVELNLHAEVKGTLKVRVESTTPVTVPPPETAEEAAKEEGREGRPDRRGKRSPRTEKGGKVEAGGESPRGARAEKGGRTERTPRTAKPKKVEKTPKSE